jgi:hypothetical protein
MSEINQDILVQLREMARRGDSVGSMFNWLKELLGPGATIVAIIDHMRSAFFLTITEVKPVAALSRTDRREVVDETLLHELVMPEIDKHRGQWDAWKE